MSIINPLTNKSVKLGGKLHIDLVISRKIGYDTLGYGYATKDCYERLILYRGNKELEKYADAMGICVYDFRENLEAEMPVTMNDIKNKMKMKNNMNRTQERRQIQGIFIQNPILDID